MKDFWRFAKLMKRYKFAISMAFVGVVISSISSVAGMGTMIALIEQFFSTSDSMKGLIHDYLAQPRIARHVDLTFAADWIPEGRFGGLVFVMTLVLFLGFLGAAGRILHSYFSYTVTQMTIMEIRAKVFQRLVHLPMSVVAQQGTSDAISRLITDANSLQAGFDRLTDRAVRNVIQGATAFGIALWLDWKITLLFMIALPLIVVLMTQFSRKVRKAMRRALKMSSKMLGAVQEVMQGLEVVKVHHAEGYERRRFHRINRKMFRVAIKVRIAKSIAGPIIESVASIAIVGVALTAAWWAFQEGDGEPPRRVMYVLMMLGITGISMKPLSSLSNNLAVAASAATRLTELLELPVEARVREELAKKTNNLAVHAESIEFEGVVFQYPTADVPALRGVDLKVSKGEVCAIVGGNGSGKSTMLRLVPRLYEPTQGRILLDGEDVSKFTLRSLRKQIAVVTQETVLFEGTVRENVLYGARQVSEAAIVDAATRARAHDFILAMPDGYDTLIGERGGRLSGGQRQRIAIARAILRDPRILILDEATSQIDADSERQINEALATFTKDRTTFVIAHRLSTVVNADKIVVMNDGLIEAVGKHDELLKDCSTYRTLCKTQLHGEEV